MERTFLNRPTSDSIILCTNCEFSQPFRYVRHQNCRWCERYIDNCIRSSSLVEWTIHTIDRFSKLSELLNTINKILFGSSWQLDRVWTTLPEIGICVPLPNTCRGEQLQTSVQCIPRENQGDNSGRSSLIHIACIGVAPLQLVTQLDQ